MTGGRHFRNLGIVPRALATAAVWSIAAVAALRLRHPLAGLSLGGLALALTIVIWLSRTEE
jgi:hypothetical protein